MSQQEYCCLNQKYCCLNQKYCCLNQKYCCLNQKYCCLNQKYCCLNQKYCCLNQKYCCLNQKYCCLKPETLLSQTRNTDTVLPKSAACLGSPSPNLETDLNPGLPMTQLTVRQGLYCCAIQGETSTILSVQV
uniref:Uncharacterized protein n=1 Tax=Esox lucius TaxID=8010 RepID=A0A3P8YH67_ESOLU